MFIKRLYFFSLLMLCFLFGAVSATVYDALTSKEVRRSRRVHTSDVVKQIDMTEAQRKQLNSVLEESRQRMIDLNRSMRPELSKIRQESRDKIRQILTPEQRLQFDVLMALQDSSRSVKADSGQTQSKTKK